MPETIDRPERTAPPATATDASAEADALPLLDAEQALVDVSRLLVSRAGADLQQVLARLGDALHVDHAYFALASEEFLASSDVDHARMAIPRVPSSLLGAMVVWSRDGAPPSPTASEQAHLAEASLDGARAPCLVDGELGQQTVAIPLLSEDDQFIGYLGIEVPAGRAALSEAHRRILSVLGDILGAHLCRLAAEEARELTQKRWQSLVDRHPDSIVVTVAGAVTYANTSAARLLGAPNPEALRGIAFRDVLSAADEEAVASRHAEQLASEAPHPTEHTLIRLDGAERVVESVSVPFPGVDGAVQTVLRDVTERKESEARYQTFVETISEGVWRVDLTTPIGREARPDLQAEHVLAHGRLAELNPAMARMFWEHRSPMGDRVQDIVRVSGRPLLRALFRALAVADHRLHDYEMVVRSNDQPPRYVSINAVGQFDRGHLVSVWGSCTEITDRVAMERGMMDALEEQQERIGRDLHDSVGQLLTGIRLLSESVASRLADDEAAPAALRVAAYASEALDRVRAICRGLVPPHLYSEGVASALAELADHADALSATQCTFRLEPGVDLRAPEVGIQLYRIAQEAISNALRHAQASNVWVNLRRNEGDVVMEIEDDGVGFELDRARARSLGLFSMRRRAHIAGAILAILARPGGGTTVQVSIPYRDVLRDARPHTPLSSVG